MCIYVDMPCEIIRLQSIWTAFLRRTHKKTTVSRSTRDRRRVTLVLSKNVKIHVEQLLSLESALDKQRVRYSIRCCRSQVEVT